MNYPIYKNQWTFSTKQIMDYLSVYADHMLDVEINIDSPLTFSTYHLFNDGLEVKLHWSFLQSPLLRECIINKTIDLLERHEKEEITFSHYEILSYSQGHRVKALPNKVEKDFDKVMKSNEDFQYESAEFEVNKPSTIPPSFFDDLIYCVDQSIRFEKFYEEKK